MTAVIGFNQQQNFGAVGAQFGTRTAVVLGAAENAVVPIGWHLITCDAGTSVQYTYDSGGNFVEWVAASTTKAVWSDGFNVRILAGGGGGTAQRSAIKGAV